MTIAKNRVWEFLRTQSVAIGSVGTIVQTLTIFGAAVIATREFVLKDRVAERQAIERSTDFFISLASLRRAADSAGHLRSASMPDSGSPPIPEAVRMRNDRYMDSVGHEIIAAFTQLAVCEQTGGCDPRRDEKFFCDIAVRGAEIIEFRPVQTNPLFDPPELEVLHRAAKCLPGHIRTIDYNGFWVNNYIREFPDSAIVRSGKLEPYKRSPYP